MKTMLRGLAMAAAATGLLARGAWAHSGHVTEGGLWQTLAHLLSSPYHVAVLVAGAVLAGAWWAALRPVRRASVGQPAPGPDPGS